MIALPSPGSRAPTQDSRKPRPDESERGFPVELWRCSGVAGELLPQSLQSLVRGERALRCRRHRGRAAAGGLARRGRRRGVRGRRRRGAAGLLGLLDLLLVGLPARVRLGVLRLPGGPLLLVALEPLPRLGVEALRVEVVALLVVARRHAVERRVELLRVDVDAFVGLLERQRDAATLEVDVDDLDEHAVADLHDLLGDLDVTLGELGDVHQTLDALLHADERTERHQLGDLAGHDLPDLVRAGEGLPRVFLGRLERQRDPLAVHVDVEDLDGDLLADLDDLGRVVDVLPGQLGDVHEAVHATQVDERTEVDDRGDHTLADLALLELREEVLADLGLGLLEPRTAGQDHVVAVLVELDDLGLELHADVRLEVADAAHLDQRRGQEAAQADVDDQTTLDDLDDLAGDDTVLVLDLLDRAPGALVLSPLLGQDQPTLLVLLLLDEGLDLVTDGDHVERVHVVLDGELFGGDHAFGLVTDVEQDLVPVDLDDGAADDVTVVEVLDGRVDRGQESLGRVEVVDRNLRRSLERGRHVVGA